ncbi:MAG: hypothetical protein A4S09_09860 [Proteobacteria bacterium SG_bin7]|nr:MAG: hypothetical protein A4S09_09860 [Proteobacteria bacterium SG_bin7]
MKLKILRSHTRHLRVRDIERIMLGSEPFRTYGFDKKSCRKIINNNRKNEILIAKLKNDIVGFAIYETTFLNGYYLKLIAIDPSQRSIGIGNKLMTALENEILKKKKKVLYLCVTDFNRRAQKFYKKRGYKKVGRLTNYAKKGIDEFLMRKVFKT